MSAHKDDETVPGVRYHDWGGKATWLCPKRETQAWEHVIRTKLLPAFGKKMLSEIATRDIIAWQNELPSWRDEKKHPCSPTWLKSIHNEGGVPAVRGGVMDKPTSCYAFEMLYCCGIREGELLMLPPADFDT